MNNNGFELLTWADVGWVHHFSTEPVIYPDDLKKLKMFVFHFALNLIPFHPEDVF